MFAGTQRKGGQRVCVEEVGGQGWLSMVLFVLFFSVRGKTAELRKSFAVAREEAGAGLPEGVLRTRSCRTASSQERATLECHPYMWHADPYKAPSGPRRRPIGITRQTENQRGRLECSLLTTLGPLRSEQLKETGERSETGKRRASCCFFFFELHLFFLLCF